jgi:SAM-dependent methyltransferase
MTTDGVRHPARFSDRILDVLAVHVAGSAVLLDPFAGTGRTHELRAVPGVVRTIGVEIEPEWAALHPDTLVGDALDLGALVAPGSIDHVVTSPTYGNRMADHHDAKDDSVRNTYKHALGRDLANHNSGQMQWGPVYRAFHERAWAEAAMVLRPGGRFTVNVKNHVRNGEVQRVVEWHLDTLMHGFGLRMLMLDTVPTRGLAHGSNGALRTGFEVVATLTKSD